MGPQHFCNQAHIYSMVKKSEKGNSIKGIERAVRIIDTLQKYNYLTLTDLSSELDIPTSTAHVYLQTLEQQGLVVRNDGEYRNSLKFLEYGGYVRQQSEIYDAARPVLRDLAIQTGKRAGLGVEERGKRVLLFHEDGSQAVSDNVPIGECTEMHWTGLGKCLLAYQPETKQNKIIEDSDLPKATDETITDPEELRKELHAIKKQGYAIENEERREGIRSAAVPVLTPDDQILGAIGLTGPTGHFGHEQMSSDIALLQRKANIIKIQAIYY